MYRAYENLKKKYGVTDYQVAKATGIATSTLTNWKHGRYTPKIGKLSLIAKFFGVPLEYFINEK